MMCCIHESLTTHDRRSWSQVSREDLSHGQRVLSYSIETQHTKGGAWAPVGTVLGRTVAGMVVDQVGSAAADIVSARFTCTSGTTSQAYLREFAVYNVVPPA